MQGTLKQASLGEMREKSQHTQHEENKKQSSAGASHAYFENHPLQPLPTKSQQKLILESEKTEI